MHVWRLDEVVDKGVVYERAFYISRRTGGPLDICLFFDITPSALVELFSSEYKYFDTFYFFLLGTARANRYSFTHLTCAVVAICVGSSQRQNVKKNNKATAYGLNKDKSAFDAQALLNTAKETEDCDQSVEYLLCSAS